MSTQALYRKWRSQTFEEIIGQDHVTKTLRNAVREGRIAHAYLFSGPRGTGKTSTARILAKAVNCIGETDEKPCNQCSICHSITEGRSLDLIEIDAASNRGIDEIRDLREKVRFAPNECRYKVYVIDEVHMLTNEAFNALLKTLEEPPPHALFVLCTTEPQKIPATVLSRCQRFDFHRISLKDLLRKLHHICEAEGIRIEPEALELIARQAGGSFRDAESLLDQLASFGDEMISLKRVQDMLGAVSTEIVGRLVDYLVEGDMTSGLALINDTIDAGIEPRQFNAQLLNYLRGLLLLKAGGAAKLLEVTDETLATMKKQVERLSLPRLIRAIRLFNEVTINIKRASQIQLPLELAFVEAVITTDGEEPKDLEARVAASVPSASRSGQEVIPSEGEKVSRKPRSPEAQKRTMDSSPSEASEEHRFSLSWLQENWTRVQREARPYNRAVEALLRASVPIEVRGKEVVLGFRYEFHKNKIQEPKNKGVVEKVLEQVTGTPCQVSCVLTTNTQQRVRNKRGERNEILNDPVVKAARNLGGRVVDVQVEHDE